MTPDAIRAAMPAEHQNLSDEQIMAVAEAYLNDPWMPISEYVKPPKMIIDFIICHHEKHRWIRFGFYYSELKKWYYSGTNERAQYAQEEGEAPTHFMRMPLTIFKFNKLKGTPQ